MSYGQPLDSEIEDAWRVLRDDLGIPPEFFRFDAEDDAPPPTSTEFHPRWTVVATHLGSGFTRSYKAGHARAWVHLFDQDLREGAFGPLASVRSAPHATDELDGFHIAAWAYESIPPRWHWIYRAQGHGTELRGCGKALLDSREPALKEAIDAARNRVLAHVQHLAG